MLGWIGKIFRRYKILQHDGRKFEIRVNDISLLTTEWDESNDRDFSIITIIADFFQINNNGALLFYKRVSERKDNSELIDAYPPGMWFHCREIDFKDGGL